MKDYIANCDIIINIVRKLGQINSICFNCFIT